MPYFVVVVDGLIGSGKTSVLKELQKLGYKVEFQRTSEWTYLGPYASDPKRFAEPLQRQVIGTYNDVAKELNNNKPEYEVVFVESCALASFWTFGKMLLESGILADDFMKELHAGIVDLNPSLYVMLNTTPNTATERVSKRGNVGDVIVDVSYQTDLDKHYKSFIQEHKNTMNVLEIQNDTNGKAHSIAADIHNLVRSKLKGGIRVCLEGLLGVGKSSIGKIIQKRGMGIFWEQVVDEDMKALLDKKYDPKLNEEEQESARVDVQLAYLEQYTKVFESWDVHKVGIVEGAFSIPIFTKVDFHSGKISRKKYLEIKEKYKKSVLPAVDDFHLVVLLTTTLDKAHERILERGRECEKPVSKQFISDVRAEHAEYFRGTRKNLHVIDNTNKSPDEVVEEIYKKLKQICFE